MEGESPTTTDNAPLDAGTTLVDDTGGATTDEDEEVIEEEEVSSDEVEEDQSVEEEEEVDVMDTGPFVASKEDLFPELQDVDMEAPNAATAAPVPPPTDSPDSDIEEGAKISTLQILEDEDRARQLARRKRRKQRAAEIRDQECYFHMFMGWLFFAFLSGGVATIVIFRFINEDDDDE